MLRIRNISQASQQRTLRALYAQSQAYPYATNYSPVVYDITGGSAGVFTVGSGASPGTGGYGPVWPGMVAALAKDGQSVCVAVGASNGGTACALQPWGLFGNFVGGDFDEVGDYTEVGVWKGPGSVFEVLSPVFNSAITASNDTGVATARYLYPDNNGKLTVASGITPMARLIDWVSASKIVVELMV